MAEPETQALAAWRVTVALKWPGIVVGSIVVVLLMAAAVLDANADALRGPLSRAASGRLHRAVHIDGRLELHLFSWHPRFVINQLRIANPDWVTPAEVGAKGGATTDMARIGQLVVVLSIPALFKGDVLLPYVGVDDSDLNLVRASPEKANWSFAGGPSKPSAEPAKFPLLGSLHLGKGHLRVTDEVRKLRFQGVVSADQRTNGGPLSLGLNGDGTINGESFKLAASGDPLITAESHKPYTVSSEIQAGHTKVKSRITITKPFDMGSVVADIDASGDDLADLYYLSGLALPNTSPYTVSTHVRREGALLKLTDFRGTLGNSDIRGTLSLETARQRPLLTADLATRSLDIKDLGPTLGSRQAKSPSSLSRQQTRTAPQSSQDSTAEARGAAPKAAKTGEETQTQQVQDNGSAPGNTLSLHGAKPKSAQTRTAEARQAVTKAAHGQTLLPDAKLDLKRIRAMDANVKYRAESVKTQKMNIRQIVVDLKLDNGVLSFTPVSFVLPQGKMTSNIRVDGSQDVPVVAIDSRVTQVQLSQFKMKGGGEPIDGTLVARAILHGRGKSLHEIGATAEGTLSAVIPHGDIRSAFAELIGIDVVKGLGLVLTGNQDKAGIRCGVANFKAEGGVFAAQDIVFDTDKVLVLGRGEVDLGTEIIDLTLSGQPKKFRFFRIKSPVEIHGTLKSPKIGLKPGNTPGEIALATALGVLATPLASVVAFIDPGLAKDADCNALIAEAEREGAHPAKDARSAQDKPAPQGAPIKDAQRSTKARSMT